MRIVRLLVISFLLIALPGLGAVVNQIGVYTNWTVDWRPITSANDPNDGLTKNPQIDFVGNASNPGTYWADNGTYVFFRFRVNVATVTSTTFRDSHFLLIDVDNYLYGSGFGTNITGRPDFGLVWDSKSNDPLAHGLEMSIFNTGANIWNGINMDDIDGSAGQKLANDINGAGRTTDGYVRTVDGQTTSDLGTTTFMDYAVSWSYLETYTDLERGQTWNVTLASIAGATDHNNLTGDIAGGASPTSAITEGWTRLGAVPEPTVVGLLSVSGIGVLVGRRLIDPKLRKAIFG